MIFPERTIYVRMELIIIEVAIGPAAGCGSCSYLSGNSVYAAFTGSILSSSPGGVDQDDHFCSQRVF